MTDLYERQKTLNLDVPEQVTIVGVGGIGYWMALGLAMAGVKRLILIDPDTVEENNCNRVPFHKWDVGSPKIDAAAAMISELRPNCEVTTYPTHTDNLSRLSLEKINSGYVVDCRDNIRPLKGVKKPMLKAGYNGTGMTVHINPNYDDIFGDDAGGYTIIPSWVGTPMMIAGLCLHFICSSSKSEKEELVSFDAYEIVDGMKQYSVTKHKEIKNVQ